jgi:hypothetical protein
MLRIPALLIFLWLSSQAQETIHPGGFDIASSYSLSATNVLVSDTIIVSRTVTNGENFGLLNLYLADNMPRDFAVFASAITIDGIPVSCLYSGAMADMEIPGYDSHVWAIDIPGGPDSIDIALMPGQQLHLEYRLNCQTPGSYILPFETLCFYGDTTGFFTTSNELYITIQSTAVNPGDRLPGRDRYFRSYCYPNPCNGRAIIQIEPFGNITGPMEFYVYDITGRLIEFRPLGSVKTEARISWVPKVKLASGIYYYRLRAGESYSFGEMTLMK